MKQFKQSDRFIFSVDEVWIWLSAGLNGQII